VGGEDGSLAEEEERLRFVRSGGSWGPIDDIAVGVLLVF
jgi:hypothetical protein